MRFVRASLAGLLLLAAIPLGVAAGVMVVVGLATEEGLTRDGWEMAASSGVAALVALVSGSWLLSRRRT